MLNIQTNTPMLVQITPDQLREVCTDIVRDVLNERREAPHVDDALVPSSEARKILNVCASTLWRWEKLRYLIPRRVGSKRYYLKSDIQNIMNYGEGK